MSASPRTTGAARAGAKRVLRPLRRRVRRAGSVLRSGQLWASNVLSRRSILGESDVVVSLTTHGTRIRSVALAVESIAAGRVKPARLMLWLDHDLVLPDGKLPASVERLRRRGLEVLVAQNSGPHGKYFGYVSSLPEHLLPLVTADDDILYPRRWLQTLVQAHSAHPQEVHCHWARRITFDDSGLAPYTSWPAVTTRAAAPAHFALGVSGVIYPPRLLNELARRGRAFEASCPKADDIWLHWVALQSGIRVRQVSAVARHFPLIAGTQDEALGQDNVGRGGNDLCIERLYSKEDLGTLSTAASAWADR